MSLFMQTVGRTAANAKRLSPAASRSAAFSWAPSAQNGRHLSVVEAALAADGHGGGGGSGRRLGHFSALVHGGSAAESGQPKGA